jgi:uncharacterized phiE125 gp8 family phage protein
MIYPKLITAPATEPVDAEWLKSHLRFDIEDEDGLIDQYISAARQYYEQFCQVSMITQTHEEQLQYWWEGCHELYWWPVISISSIKYVDEDNVESSDIQSLFDVDLVNRPAVIQLKDGVDYPDDLKTGLNVIKIRYVSGFGAATAVPALLKQAITLRASASFANRLNTTPLALYDQADVLAHIYKRIGV